MVAANYNDRRSVPMLKPQTTVLVWLCLLCEACSHEQVYQSIQYNRQLECQQYVGEPHQECMKTLQQSYQNYRRQRGDDDER